MNDKEFVFEKKRRDKVQQYFADLEWSRKPPPRDYMKWWAAIKRYMVNVHDITSTEFDMLVFLRSERYFKPKKFYSYSKLFSWDYRKQKSLIDRGWLKIWRKGNRAADGRKRGILLCTTTKCNNMIDACYRIVEGEWIDLEPYERKMTTIANKRWLDCLEQLNEDRKNRVNILPPHQTP